MSAAGVERDLPASTGPMTRAWVSRMPAWGWVLAYGMAWLLAFHVSSIYWFLPAGLRLAALWLSRRRWWPALAAAEWTVILLVLGVAPYYGTMPGLVLAVFAPFVAHAVAVSVVRRERAIPDSPGRMSRLFLAMALAALLSSVLLTLMHMVEGRASAGGEPTLAFDLFTGDFVAMVLVAPLALHLAWDAGGAHPQPPRRLVLGFVLALAACLGAGRTWSEVAVHAAILSLAPMLLVAARGGWRAASWAVAVTGVSVYAIGTAAEPLMSPALVQMVLCVIGACALVLGAGADEQHRAALDLAAANAALAEANRRLEERSDALRALGRRVLDAQEAEQQRISREIHDELARATSTLGVSLGLEARRSGSPEMVAAVDSLRELVRELQGRVRLAVERVAPSRLDGPGLRKALEDGALASSLRESGIPLTVQTSGDWRDLDRGLAARAYRFVHDVCWQAQREGGVDSIDVLLALGGPGAERDMLVAVRTARREGHGGSLDVAGLADRVQASGGVFSCQQLADGTEYRARYLGEG